MSVNELKRYLADVDDTLNVNVIFDGVIDTSPELNVADETLYIEGVSPMRGGAK